MLHKRSFVKKTRKGNVLKVVREHYLRDDLPCHSAACELCVEHMQAAETVSDVAAEEDGGSNAAGTHVTPAMLEAESDQYLVLDTNVVLLQIDLLAHGGKEALRNVIIPQTVLEEVKHRDVGIYKRLRGVISNRERHFIVFSNEHHRETYIERLQGESPNDRNDRGELERLPLFICG
jgi:exosome complex exonuclease DIS3/RRP44